MRTITVKGTGNVSARPDYIILTLNIEALSESYDRAMSEAAERIERLQGAAVRVAAVTASPAHKGVDFRPLPWCDSEHHRFRLLSVFSGSKKADGNAPTARLLPSIY